MGYLWIYKPVSTLISVENVGANNNVFSDCQMKCEMKSVSTFFN